MFVLALTVSALFATFAVPKAKRHLESQDQRRCLLYHFYCNCLEFLVPLSIVAGLYLLLWGIVWAAPQWVSVQDLIRLEQFFTDLKCHVSIFKLSELQVLVILLVLFLLALARLRLDLHPLFERYQKGVRRLYILVVLLCSFTFFGTQVGEPDSHLRLRIKTIREGYAEVCRGVESIVSEELASKLYEKSLAAFPASYHEALHQPGKMESQVGDLRSKYSKAQKEYGLNIKRVDTLLETYSSRAAHLPSTDQPIAISTEGQSRAEDFASHHLSEVTEQKVVRAKEAINECAEQAY